MSSHFICQSNKFHVNLLKPDEAVYRISCNVLCRRNYKYFNETLALKTASGIIMCVSLLVYPLIAIKCALC